MDIIHVLPLHEEPDHHPLKGAELLLLDLMREQVRCGLNVTLAPLVTGYGGVLERTFASLERDGIGVCCIPAPMVTFAGRPRLNHLKTVWSLREILASRRPTIVHTHLDLADLDGKVAAWLAGHPHVVSSMHAADPKYAQLRWTIRLRLLDLITSRYIAVSAAMRDCLVNVPRLPAEKIDVVHNGYRKPERLLSKSELRERLELPQEAFVVGVVGRLTEQKNPLMMIDALRCHPSVLGVFVGDGHLRFAMEARIREGGLQNVRLLGGVSNAADLMPAFDALCIPSVFEGFGGVVVEAMLRRVPVLASHTPPVKEVLDGGRLGHMFDPHSLDELTAVLDMARTDPVALRKHVDEAQVFAQQHYTVEAMAAGVLQTYERVLG